MKTQSHTASALQLLWSFQPLAQRFGAIAGFVLFCAGFVLQSSSLCDAAVGANAISLEAAYQAALKRSETIADQLEQVQQAEETYKQAIATVLPSVSGSAAYLFQDPNGSSTYSPSSQPLVKLTASQPLFQGFREYAGLRRADKLKEVAVSTEARARVLLYNDVASNFLSLLSLEQDERNYSTQAELTQKRVDELADRVRIGRSRPSEKLTAETQLAQARAQLKSTRGQIRVTREAFRFLTGLDADTPLLEPAAPVSPSQSLAKLEQYLETVEGRPDVVASRIAYDASDEAVSIAKEGHLPVVGASGNYYLARSGVTQNVTWDAAITATVPIFQGGLILSQTRVAASQRAQAELALGRLRHHRPAISSKTLRMQRSLCSGQRIS